MRPAGRIQDALAEIVGTDAVLAGPAAEKAYDGDAYPIDRHPPVAIVLPGTTQEVSEVVKWCVREHIPFTPRGAGTGLSGGAMPAMGGVVISTKRLTRILEIDVPNRMMKAEAGVPNMALSRAVADHGLHFAPDPSSQSVSTLGGNIAENSGGPHTLKYGVTAQHILHVTLVDPSGDVLEIGSLVPGAPGPDFVGLVVGSEGTFGIVTEAWIKLTPVPKEVQTALAAFPSVRDATEAVSAIIASGVIPAALEFMDIGILRALKAAFGLEYPEGTHALLLIECDSVEADGRAVAEMVRVESICREQNALDLRVAADATERAKLWTARKKGIGAMGRLAPSIVTHDGVIPRSKLPEMLDFVYQVAEKYNVGVANLFHAGDGNLHPCMYFDARDPAQVEAVVAAGEEIIGRCIELGGSVTGEHGIGVEKSDLLKLMFSEHDMRLQALAKSIFSDGTLCNPCKVIPDQRGCVEHMRRSKGVAW